MFALAAILGCGGSPVTPSTTDSEDLTRMTEPPPMASHGEVEQFVARVKIDPRPGHKRFQGVWLVRADGFEWLADYRARPWYRPYAGLTVTVTGERYEPEGQAIGAQHFKIHTLRIDEASMVDPVGIGPEHNLHGTFVERTGEEGSKLEGTSWMVFVDDEGREWQLMNPSAIGELTGPVAVKARAAERSPFVASLGGPSIWVLSAFEKP